MIAGLEKRYAATSGGRIAFVDAGPRDAPALLLLHGFPSSSYQWRDLLPVFASRFRVIAPDMIGYGDSDKPASAAVDAEAQTRYVGELLEELAVERLAVVGHGPGGAVAQLLALDRVGVEALVLLDSSGLDPWAPDALRALDDALQGDESGALAATVAMELGSAQSVPAEVLDELSRPFTGKDGSAAFARILASLDERPLAGREAELEELQAPVLILWGERDPFLPVDAAERLNDAIPASSLGLLPERGHYIVEEAGETIGPMIYEYLRARYLHAPHGHEDKSGIVMLQLERRPPWIDQGDDDRDDRDDRFDGDESRSTIP